MSKAYSYHTFIFPFLWNVSGEKTRKDFEGYLASGWEKVTSSAADEETFVAAYNQYRYVNAPARHAIDTAGKEGDAVWNYRYRLPGKQTEYVLEKEGRETISLAINSISLKLYDSGIGILLFATENKSHDSVADFNRINDMARCVFRPFINDREGACGACADRVSIRFEGGILCEGALNEKPETPDELRLIEPILFLLSNDSIRASANKKEADASKKLHYIEPVLDERMFVAAYYVNAPFVNACTLLENCSYRYEQAGLTYLASDMDHDSDKDNLAATLYRIFYVDGSGFTTCRHRRLLAEMLDKAIYKRWLEGGTIIGITDYSMISITNSDSDFLRRNFLTEYVEMVTLVLAQRASLRNYEGQISACGAKKRSINRIHDSYMAFQSQLLLKEVSSQQQAMELYSLMKQNLFIEEQVCEVEKHLEALFTQKSSYNESKENLILFVIAVLAVIDPMNTFASWLGDGSGLVKIGIFAVLAAYATILYLHKRK